MAKGGQTGFCRPASLMTRIRFAYTSIYRHHRGDMVELYKMAHKIYMMATFPNCLVLPTLGQPGLGSQQQS